jgi:hypothetical protein
MAVSPCRRHEGSSCAQALDGRSEQNGGTVLPVVAQAVCNPAGGVPHALGGSADRGGQLAAKALHVRLQDEPRPR